MSQITKQLEADAKVRRRMEKLLQWTEAELNEVEYQQGLAWLGMAFGHSDAATYDVLRRKLEASAAFWAWWKNQWRRLDAQLNPNLRAVEVCGEWMLGYFPPNNGPTYYSQDSLYGWQSYYQHRHQLDTMHLRPGEEMLARILKAV